MKKRGIFSVVLLLSLATLFGTQNFTDIGKTYGLEISDQALAKAEVNSASTVTVITKEQIETYNATSTADLVGKAIGTTYNSYGALGAAQSVQIRGTSASKTLVYLDGVLMNNAHSASFDLSSIPVSSIESIEIIKSGSGNLGRTNAIGGIVNIITTKGTPSPTPFTLSIENGSFLPQSYGSKRNWLGLVDSQKLDFTYSDEIQGISIVSSVGGMLAQNGYIYESGGTRALRENAGMYNIHGSTKISGAINEKTDFTSNTIISYQDVGVPGDLIWGLTPDNYQQDFSLTTANSVILENTLPSLETLAVSASYDYRKTYYNNVLYASESTHNKHKGNTEITQKWDVGENYALESGINVAFDYVDSTDVGQNHRFTSSLFATGSIYLSDGKLSFHPNANLLYLSDTKVFSPNASIGMVYEFTPQLKTNLSISYAENVPDFSLLYWPVDPIFGGGGNPNLKTEKGLNLDIGLHYSNEIVSYESVGFFRNIDNAIANDNNFVPQNIAHSMYFGTEQSVTIQISKAWSISASYQLNKSYDLSGSHTLSDNVEVANIRKHTAKAAIAFEMGMFQAILGGEVLGKSINMPTNIFLCNLMVNARFSETLKAYIGVDNLLNTQYEYNAGYPMPGMKVRLGGDWKF